MNTPRDWLRSPDNLDGVDMSMDGEGITWARRLQGGPTPFPPEGMKWLRGFALVAGQLGGVPLAMMVFSVSDEPDGPETAVWPVALTFEGVTALHDNLEHLVVAYAECLQEEEQGDANPD